ncbi:hypothetical protein [Streptomyces sp. CHB9.2]|uniref:hypothetical protein n=1 Tax=Streptomyces sp. CHB9.2 TaxID=2841670 RepID=UPI002095CC10|nr:hypothetical protein [Streptomyces sp. CHB9.2]MCO6704704.1 hypothetical protein [Streptomyces sp. CHB9.2]
MMNDIVTGLNLASKLTDTMRAAKSGSLIEYTQPTRVEPIVLMDESLIRLPYANDIMQSLTSLFSGYYLQAIALSVNVGSVDVIRLLDKLNPKRNATDNLINGVSNGVATVVSLEDARSYRFALPVPGGRDGLQKLNVSLEDIDDPIPEGNPPTLTNGRDTVSMLGELTNLSVGKMLEVNIESEGNKATFPINVRLICSGIGTKELVHILSVGSKNISVKERFHAWRAGQLEFVRDLLLCQDLIDAHKKTLAKDPTGLYDELRKRRKGNSISAIFSGQPSVATASNIIVMSSQAVKDVERQVGGRLKDFRVREKLFRETYCMILCVVDPEWEHVTFYHRSIAIPTEMSVKELAVSNKGKGPDVAEILKAYQLGNSPAI